MPSSPADPADAIAAALARLRGRRMPRPPWDPGAAPHGGGHGSGPRGSGPFGPFSHGPHGGSGDGSGDGPGWPRHGGRGGPWPSARLSGPARLRLLEALAAASHPLSVGEIAEAIGVDQPRASRLVQQSVDLELVRREADPDDARRTRVALTERGAALVKGFRGERREAIAAALDAFTDDERAQLARLLTKLADNWPRG